MAKPMIHGVHCNTKTFPLRCRDCGQELFLFSCDHESRVLFDHLAHLGHCNIDSAGETPPEVQMVETQATPAEIHRPGFQQYLTSISSVRAGEQTIFSLVCERGLMLST